MAWVAIVRSNTGEDWRARKGASTEGNQTAQLDGSFVRVKRTRSGDHGTT